MIPARRVVFAARVADPKNHILQKHEVKIIVLTACIFIFVKWGRFNAGIGLARAFANYLDNIYEKSVVNWVKKIMTKLHNLERTNAHVRSHRLHTCNTHV